MKLSKWIRRLDEGRLARSADIKVTSEWTKNLIYPLNWFKSIFRMIIGKSSKLITRLVRFKVTNLTNSSEYVVYLEAEPKKNYSQFLDSEVKFFCSCNDFKFRAAYKLNEEGNLFKSPKLEEHLGIALTTKPTKVVTTPMCKHVIAVIDTLKHNLDSVDLKI